LGFVYPSEYEGFGIPILEAYQADCPVILNRASCFPEIAGDAALYFSSEEELTAQIERLLSMSTEDRNALLAKQKERLSRYSWEKSARQMAKIYQSLCK
jgi:glycosyltransferase involved in cell wall biosynthesis